MRPHQHGIAVRLRRPLITELCTEQASAYESARTSASTNFPTMRPPYAEGPFRPARPTAHRGPDPKRAAGLLAETARHPRRQTDANQEPEHHLLATGEHPPGKRPRADAANEGWSHPTGRASATSTPGQTRRRLTPLGGAFATDHSASRRRFAPTGRIATAKATWHLTPRSEQRRRTSHAAQTFPPCTSYAAVAARHARTSWLRAEADNRDNPGIQDAVAAQNGLFDMSRS